MGFSVFLMGKFKLSTLRIRTRISERKLAIIDDPLNIEHKVIKSDILLRRITSIGSFSCGVARLYLFNRIDDDHLTGPDRFDGAKNHEQTGKMYSVDNSEFESPLKCKMSPSKSKLTDMSDSENSDAEDQQQYTVEDTQGNSLPPVHPVGEERRGLWTPEVCLFI